MNRKLITVVGVSALAFSAPAWVHHSGAMFDTGKKQELVGTISEFNWTNPHASFKVDVPDAQGVVTTWAVEMGSPNNMIRDGWKRSTLKPGTKVTVVVTPLRNGKPGGSFMSVTFADGSKKGMQPPSDVPTYPTPKPAAP
jgi:Family of unknown function (DUF6152)